MPHTDSDFKAARQTWLEEVEPALFDDSYDGPELVVLSTGYAEVFADGDVVQHGTALFNVSED